MGVVRLLPHAFRCSVILTVFAVRQNTERWRKWWRAQALNYQLAEGVSEEDLAGEDKYYLSDGYKRSVLEHMSTPQLLDMLLIHPTVSISPSYRDTGLTAIYTFKPLSNLVRTTPLPPPPLLPRLTLHAQFPARAVHSVQVQHGRIELMPCKVLMLLLASNSTSLITTAPSPRIMLRSFSLESRIGGG